MTEATTPRVLLVGERFNLGGRRWPSAERLMVRDCASWLERSRAMGCYTEERNPRGREKLQRAGLRWDDALNLLPPAACSEWDADLAAWAGYHLEELLGCEEPSWTYHRVLLLGARVARAIELKYVPLKQLGRYVMVPHPSGLSRAWNDPTTFCRARALMEEVLR